jgi:hypothetical protein
MWLTRNVRITINLVTIRSYLTRKLILSIYGMRYSDHLSITKFSESRIF